MKRLLVLLACLLSVSVSAQRVAISPVITDTNFGNFVLVFAEQLPLHSVSIRESPTLFPTDWAYEIASYGCYTQLQWVVGSYPAQRYWQESAYFKSINSPCSEVGPFGMVDPLTQVEESLVICLDGRKWRLQPLPKFFPPRLDGVKRFLLLPLSGV
jgi:hypothetical protein